MTSLELALIQVALLIVIAPLCVGIGSTIVTIIKEKKWVSPWVGYRRENSVIAAVAFGAAVTFAALLPLMTFDGLAGTDGNTFVLIAILALTGGAVALLDAASVMPRALCAIGTSFLALSVASNSINGSSVFFATAGDTRPAIVLVAIAIGLTLIALWNDTLSIRSRDVRTVFNVVMGVFLANLIAMITLGNQLTSTIPAVNVAILAGKAIGATLIISALAAGAKRHTYSTPMRLIRAATFLGILSIIVTLWQFNG